ncbi:protein RESTRICTED TEV MOVEMENT 2 [Musa acuminata AAA Group]|uniref:protein RESTRICTED TEV MOVEMENT 2 n=1 Tax=Musa acuminata AAA Group TaxID=214697 RepID=UPI0031DA9FE1
MDTKPRTASAARSYEDFKPTTELVPGEVFDTYHIRLPGFRKDHVRVQVDNQGKLRTSGERPLDGRRWSRFYVEFTLPENCNLRDVRARFENETLQLRLPKLIAPEPVVQIEEREEEKKLQPPKEEKDEAAKSSGDKKMVPRTETDDVKEKEKEEAAKSNGDKKMVPRTETDKVKEKEKEEAAKSNGDKKMVPRMETEKVKEKEKVETSSKEKVEEQKLNGDKTTRPREEAEKEKEEVKDDKDKVDHGGEARAEQPAWPELGGMVMELSQTGKTLISKLAAAMLVLLGLVLYLKYKLTKGETRSAASL